MELEGGDFWYRVNIVHGVIITTSSAEHNPSCYLLGTLPLCSLCAAAQVTWY